MQGGRRHECHGKCEFKPQRERERERERASSSEDTMSDLGINRKCTLQAIPLIWLHKHHPGI